jgi:[acyl-carrier-protein] S-malonyltransferase
MKIALLFPGYGSQFVGMGKELYDESRIMQEYFEEASTVLNTNFVKLCFASSDAEIRSLDQSLVATFLVSSSIYAHIKDQEGLVPDAIVGYTSGQYAALCATEGINFPDMLYLIQKYTSYYQELLTQVPIRAIRVSGIDRMRVDNICAPYTSSETRAFVSVYQSEHEFIIAGHQEAIAQISESLPQVRKITELEQVEGLHSPLMSMIEAHLRTYSAKVDFKDPKVPYIAQTSSEIITTADALKEELLRQIVLPLEWAYVVKKLADYDAYIEIGPGTQLSDALRERYPEKPIVAINKGSDSALLHDLLMQKTN